MLLVHVVDHLVELRAINTILVGRVVQIDITERNAA
jgi:hypothetical protein